MSSLLSPYGPPVVHVGIGEGRVFEGPSRVHVLLGSCVAVTFHLPGRGLGATFHALLPCRKEYACKDATDTPFRYVDTAIETLLTALTRAGVALDRLQIKVFGGANSLVQGEFGVGQQNVRTAFTTLAKHGLRVAASNVGGTRGRKLVFLPATGEVFMKVLSETPVRGMSPTDRC